MRLRDVDVEPALRVDRKLIARIDQDRRRLGLDNGRPGEPVARPEIVERVNVDLAPGAEEDSTARTRRTGGRCGNRPRLRFGYRDLSDRGNAGVHEHDLLLRRGIGVELLVAGVEARLDVLDQRRLV